MDEESVAARRSRKASSASNGGNRRNRGSALDFEWTPNPKARTLSLVEQIAEDIGNRILDGQFEPGDRLHEQRMAQDFNCSRGPVREALRLLERDGLVRVTARKGAQVTQLTSDEVREIFELRAALIGLAARLVASGKGERLSDEMKARIKDLEKMAPTAPTEDYVREAFRLNVALIDASGNRYLKTMFAMLMHQSLRYARIGLSTAAQRRRSLQNWRKLFAAIESGDAAEAQRSAEALGQESQEKLVNLLKKT